MRVITVHPALVTEALEAGPCVGLARLSGPVSACHVLGLWEGIYFLSPPWNSRCGSGHALGIHRSGPAETLPHALSTAASTATPRCVVLAELHPKCSIHCTRVWVNVCLCRVVFLFQDDIWGHPRNGLVGPMVCVFLFPRSFSRNTSGATFPAAALSPSVLICPLACSASASFPLTGISSVNTEEECLPCPWCRLHCWLYCGFLCCVSGW